MQYSRIQQQGIHDQSIVSPEAENYLFSLLVSPAGIIIFPKKPKDLCNFDDGKHVG